MPVLPFAQMETDKIVRYSGVTNGSGLYSVTYAAAYPAGKIPSVIPSMVGAPNTHSARVTASSETGFTVKVESRSLVTILSIEVLSSAVTPVTNQAVSVIVMAND